MTKAERIEIIQQLLDAGQTEEEIKDYLIKEAKWDLKPATIDKYISEAKNADDSNSGEEEESEESEEQDQSEESSEENDPEAEESDETEEEDVKEDSEETIVENIKNRLKDGEEAEDLKEEFKGRLVARAKGQIDLEVLEEKAKAQKADRDAFEKKINKHLKPAQKALETALAEIEKIKKLKRKENKNASRFAAAEKLITRILKNQLSRP